MSAALGAILANSIPERQEGRRIWKPLVLIVQALKSKMPGSINSWFCALNTTQDETTNSHDGSTGSDLVELTPIETNDSTIEVMQLQNL